MATAAVAKPLSALIPPPQEIDIPYPVRDDDPPCPPLVSKSSWKEIHDKKHRLRAQEYYGKVGEITGKKAGTVTSVKPSVSSTASTPAAKPFNMAKYICGNSSQIKTETAEATRARNENAMRVVVQVLADDAMDTSGPYWKWPDPASRRKDAMDVDFP